MISSPTVIFFNLWALRESMPNRPLRRGGRGGFEGGVQAACAYNKTPTTLMFMERDARTSFESLQLGAWKRAKP